MLQREDPLLSGFSELESQIWVRFEAWLKDSAGFFGPNGSGFSLQRRENYAYDAQNDFLTQVDYNDGQANELQSWDYDPAGNRTSASANPGSWSYDKLNRIVSSPFGSCTHDLAGNRLTGPGQTLAWDVTNRLTGLNGVTHRYRADGMRVQKVAANGDTYRWHYDAQMPVEETRVVGGQTTVMRNIVGPRGIDIQFDGANAAFPLYDTHGNAKALLARSGSTFTTAFWRQYDVWGSLRTGSTLGGASQRYCANLGHVTDDESGLVYMRARFYEPWTGRFVSEDPAMQSQNWYTYCKNQPSNLVDPDGRLFIDLLLSELDNLINQVNSGNTSRIAAQQGRSKIEEIVAYSMGRLIGICAALELDAGVSANRFFETDEGFGFRWNKGTNAHMHFADHGNGLHVDLRGKLGPYEAWFKTQFKTGAIPLEQFFDGFCDGFF